MSRPLRLPALTLTTRNLAAVYPWHVSRRLPALGVPIGMNLLADAPFHYDPWHVYAERLVSSPNMVVLGQLGVGKSALVKTYLHRQLQAGRQAYVLDPKGEYAALAHVDGLAHIALRPGGEQRLNPLDPPPGAGSAEGLLRHRTQIVATLVSTGLGRDISSEQRAGIDAAVGELGSTPVLGHIVDRLFRPSAEMARGLHTTVDGLATALRPAALELRRLLTGDLAGMVDGPSTVTVHHAGPGLVVDLAALHGTPALTPVMVCASGWLSALLDIDSQRRRLLLVDEAWALLGSPAATRWLQSISKLARRYGVQLISVVHRLSDLSAQADQDSATRRQAEGLLADAETRVIYRQAIGERATVRELLGLSEPETELVARLGTGRALWLVGQHGAVVDHVLAADEETLTDTDARMSA